VPRLDNLKGYSDAANLDSLDDRLTPASERRRRIYPDFKGNNQAGQTFGLIVGVLKG
jgi:hypothetical protein